MAVKEVTHKELKEVLLEMYDKRLSHLVIGGTGIGKSFVVFEVAEEISKKVSREFIKWNKISIDEKYKVAEHPEKYFFIMDQRLSQLDPSDLRGLPFPSKNGMNVVVWEVPLWLHVASQRGAMGIIFFDEINLAPPSLQASAYQLIYDRELGEVALAEGVVCIGAGNRLSDKANVYDMARPLQNRFTHTTLRAPIIDGQTMKDDWAEWAMNHGVDMRIITFLMQRPSLLNPKVNENAEERAFPTPRTWEVCSRLIQGKQDLEWLELLASTAIGAGAAAELASNIKFSRKIDLEDILKHPENAGKIKELDLKYSLLSLVSEWYAIHHTKDNLETVLQIANVIQAEFAILLLRYAKIKHPSQFKSTITTLKSWTPISKKYQKYLLT